MGLKFANCTTWLGHEGNTFQIVQDDAWYDEDPLVKARPDLFNDEPSAVLGIKPVRKKTADKPVEQATAAPGEKRATRRA